MGEVINLQVGQCGNQLGTKFWETICGEHGIDPHGYYCGQSESNQLERLHVYYNEAEGGQWTPRCILVNLDSSLMESLKIDSLGQLFDPNNFVSGEFGAGNVWAKGFHTEGARIIEDVLEVVRRNTETCDLLQGFHVTHSLGGGTGSGLGSLLISKLKEDYPDRFISTFSVLPSSKVSDTVVEPYNAILTAHHLLENANLTYCFDNEALHEICVNSLNLQEPTMKDFNRLTALCMSGITTSLRFPGQVNDDLNKLESNMVPYPMFKFLTPSFAPLKVNSSTKQEATITVSELITEMLDSKNMMAACDPASGQLLAGHATFRGTSNVWTEVDTHMKNIQNPNSFEFIRWISRTSKIKTSACEAHLPGLKTASTFVANTTAIELVFRRLLDQFKTMFRRKAYMYPYGFCGMDEIEFTEAECSIDELLSEYQHHQN